MLNIVRLTKSFIWAWQGIRHALKTEQNLRIHVLATVAVIVFGVFCHFSFIEWILSLQACFQVIFAEMLNTAIERVTDIQSNKHRIYLARQAKDIGAGAVLIAVIYAAVSVGSIIIHHILS